MILSDNNLSIPKDFVLIKINSQKHLTKEIAGFNLDLSSEYTRMAEEFIPDDDSLIAYDGIVEAIPLALSKKAGIDIEIKKGDHVYFHHLCTEPENRRDYKGQECYWFNYVRDYVSYVTSNIYCKVVKGEIVMLGDWNLMEIEKVKEKELSSLILAPSVSQVKKENIGYIKCAAPNSSLVPGDRVYVNPEAIYTIYIEGKSYYIVSDRDILAKITL